MIIWSEKIFVIDVVIIIEESVYIEVTEYKFFIAEWCWEKQKLFEFWFTILSVWTYQDDRLHIKLWLHRGHISFD